MIFPMHNQLSEKKSYLRQHAHQRLLGYYAEKSLISPKKDLPVLVSIGYSSCHWCQVMSLNALRTTMSHPS